MLAMSATKNVSLTPCLATLSPCNCSILFSRLYDLKGPIILQVTEGIPLTATDTTPLISDDKVSKPPNSENHNTQVRGILS